MSARAAGARWSWSASRPSYICDFAPSRARNLITVLGATPRFAGSSMCRWTFPAAPKPIPCCELSDATCLAEAIIFVSTHEAGKNTAFNVTNGDCFRWCQVWPLLARWFDVRCGVPRRMKLATWMADKGPIWDRIVARHQLQPRSLESLASWEFADFVFAKEWKTAVRRRPAAARGLQCLCRYNRHDPRSTGPIPRCEVAAAPGDRHEILRPRTGRKHPKPVDSGAGMCFGTDRSGRGGSPGPSTKLCRSPHARFSKLDFEILSEARINLQETKWQCR